MIGRNIVGHCYNPATNTDKIYSLGIRDVGGSWAVIAKWGRRNNQLSNQIQGTFSTELEAKVNMEKLWNKKRNKGYIEVGSKEYLLVMKSYPAGTVKMSDKFITDTLESESEDTEVSEMYDWGIETDWLDEFGDTTHKKQKLEEVEPQETVYICIDNNGLEEKFDVGIEYVGIELKMTPGDTAPILSMYDKMGNKTECFANRFMTTECFEETQKKEIAKRRMLRLNMFKQNRKMDCRIR